MVIAKMNLEIRPWVAETNDLMGEVSQKRVDWREDGSAVAGGQQEVGDRGHDADGGVGPNVVEDSADGTGAVVVEDLSGLHGLSRCDIESGHISSDISVTHYGD